MRRRSLLLTLVAAMALAAVCASSAAALTPLPSDRVEQATIRGWTGAPGPSRFDRLEVTKFGPSDAKAVLVLVPGTISGRGDFTLTARELVDDLPGLAVWAVDRRSNRLEDVGVFRQALAGQVSLQGMLDYYLNWLGKPSAGAHFQPQDLAKLGFAKRWGLHVQLEDVRRVVQAAGRGGRRVILGGHSLGASVAAAYAAWDFGGRAGYRDLDGLVLIDGGMMGTFSTPSATQTKARLKELGQPGASPFTDLLGVGLPWVSGVFAEVAAVAARMDPTGPSILQSFPLLPPDFKPPVPATNRAALGYAFDEGTSPKGLALIHARLGELAPSGEPRDWLDGEVTPVARLAETFGAEPANAVEWYFPRRLTIDVDGAQALRRDAGARLVGAREWHRAKIDLPLYALQTSLTAGRVLKGARALIGGSRIPLRRSVLVDASATESHLDPLTAAPDRNRYLQTVEPFLKRLVR
jgi:pimeloyl-ACP methyl ester carboxylesterase